MAGQEIFTGLADEELLLTPMSAIEDRTDAYVIDSHLLRSVSNHRAEIWQRAVAQVFQMVGIQRKSHHTPTGCQRFQYLVRFIP